MTYQESYTFILVLSGVLAMEERVIVPILRMQTGAGEKWAITYKRTLPLIGRISKPRSYVVAVPAKFTDKGTNKGGIV